MLTEFTLCVMITPQFIVDLPVWESQTPTYRTNIVQYFVKLSETETCTIALTADGNKVFINATSVNDGQPVRVSVQMTRAKFADGTEVLILFYDRRPDKKLAPARMNQLDNFVLAFKYVPYERIQWFTAMYPVNLEHYTTMFRLE
ncbi:MAG: hypothetical protein IT410_01485 [Candidatus Doudnabacteria bacterium]|nr:hypothetical protein [Candidatus Doudnabacteria bacterium]